MEVVEPVIVVEPPKVKKPVSEAKKRQLEGAREKKAVQKNLKVIEPDSDSSEDDEPVKKKSRVITKGNSGGESEWATTAIRTAALVSLAGATFYMQNIYGEKNMSDPVPAQAPAQAPVQANMLPTVNRSYVGKSGFAI